ncbi:alanine dehydrogenase/PNT domain protein [Chloroherpeton thalassium ATCC 35110]|uniref:alanine dehydrogenase n=1 Tax=Chloroherpeton thalassium (strain ATCC 35110 / GB-78) TaxID=517418 RepID=B3QZ31_CHLT3|nr:alanine dehydrogenase [Chloroherpeton thalassium]ACF13724.1 alanine dehydrogenase/PNT domain protein [Chloroherpeton thalassium ATCC 35110]
MSYTSDFGNLDFDIGLETLERVIIKTDKRMHVDLGVPKEITPDEKRVALTPSGAQILVEQGYCVCIEKGAGEHCNFTNEDYANAGASVVTSAEEVFKRSNVIVKVAPPLPAEFDYLQRNQVLVSALHLGMVKNDFIETLLKKAITGLAFEFIETRDGEFPIVRSLSEISGTLAIHIAAKYLETGNGGRGILLGGIAGVPPANVVIIGAGTVGQYAAQAALGLGAHVMVIDKELNRLRKFQTLFNRQISTATANDHYIARAARTADVMIGALSPRAKMMKPLVSEEVVMGMRKGSVIIDVSIDQTACFETSQRTSHSEPTFVKHGVTHYCVPNIPSAVARTASYALTNALIPFLTKLGEYASISDALWKSTSLRNGTYAYKGYLTKKVLSDLSGLAYREVQMLLATDL